MSGSRMGSSTRLPDIYAGRRLIKIRGEPVRGRPVFCNSGVVGKTFDEQGNIYASDAGKKMQKFNANRNFVASWGLFFGNGDGNVYA